MGWAMSAFYALPLTSAFYGYRLPGGLSSISLLRRAGEVARGTVGVFLAVLFFLLGSSVGKGRVVSVLCVYRRFVVYFWFCERSVERVGRFMVLLSTMLTFSSYMRGIRGRRRRGDVIRAGPLPMGFNSPCMLLTSSNVCCVCKANKNTISNFDICSSPSLTG